MFTRGSLSDLYQLPLQNSEICNQLKVTGIFRVDGDHLPCRDGAEVLPARYSEWTTILLVLQKTGHRSNLPF